MNHTNGQPKMTQLGHVLSQATQPLKTATPKPVQKPPFVANHYGDDAVLGVECAMPFITGGNYVVAH